MSITLFDKKYFYNRNFDAIKLLTKLQKTYSNLLSVLPESLYFFSNNLLCDNKMEVLLVTVICM